MFRGRSLRALLTPTLIFALLAAPGCSAFQPKMQQVVINTSQPGADVYVNGKLLGPAPVTVELERNKDHAIIARYGANTGTYNLGTKISGTGIADIIGTFLFLIPGIGLFTPGFWELDSKNIVVPVN